MAITVRCGHCGHACTAPDNYVGRRGKCPSCDGLFTIERAAREEAPPSARSAKGAAPVKTSPARRAEVSRRDADDDDDVDDVEEWRDEWDADRADDDDDASEGSGSRNVLLLTLAGGLLVGVGIACGALFFGGSSDDGGAAVAGSGGATTTTVSLRAGETLSTADVVALIEPSVVRINALDEQGELEWIGSGFVVDAAGIVATNWHVIEEHTAARFSSPTAASFLWKASTGSARRRIWRSSVCPCRQVTTVRSRWPPRCRARGNRC
jgi:hypothetical protein